MNIEIINTPYHIHIHGFSGIAINKDYAGTAFKLSGNMWQAVKSNNIKNKGLNIWVYEPGDRVFAGVELEEAPAAGSTLEQKDITLLRYAYYKHIGPYQLIRQTGQAMTAELNKRGLTTTLPYIEIYGHWNRDESKLETELLMSVI